MNPMFEFSENSFDNNDLMMKMKIGHYEMRGRLQTKEKNRR